jgi:tape measure domain-containing protein
MSTSSNKVRVEGDSGHLRRDLTKTERILHRLTGGFGGFNRALNRTLNPLNAVRQGVTDAHRAFESLKRAAIAGILAETARRTFVAASNFAGLQAQLTQTTKSLGLAQQQMGYMMQTVKILGTDLRTASSGFGQMQMAAYGSGLSLQQVNQTWEAFSKVLLITNADALKTEGTFRALTQMMSKGRVQAEELRGQLSEHIPGAFQLASRAMNMTTQELEEFVKTGRLVVSDLFPKMVDQIEKEFGPALIAADGYTARAIESA